MKEVLKAIGVWIIGIAILVGIGLIAMLFIEGGVWLSAKLYPWFVGISGITLLITICVLLPNAVFSATPRFAGTGMVIASYVFGVTLWLWSLLITYVLWGAVALFIGLFLMGVGVVPLAMLATLFKAEWFILGYLLLLTALTFGIRHWGYYLLAKAEGSDSWFRVLLWSLKKSSRLKRIARKLTPTSYGGESFMRAFAEGGFDAITARLARLDKIEEGKRELFALIREDPVTSKLLQDYGIDEEALDELYNKLVRGGAGIYEKGHWIPASALAFGQTLEYLLKKRNTGQDEFKNICYRLWQYFSDNEIGEIEN